MSAELAGFTEHFRTRDFSRRLLNVPRNLPRGRAIRAAMILPDDATPKPDGIFGKDKDFPHLIHVFLHPIFGRLALMRHEGIGETLGFQAGTNLSATPFMQ
jgi:hypothetical protein